MPEPTTALRTVWIIDGAYLYAHGRTRPFDYLKLKREVERASGGPLYESYYLNSVPPHASGAQASFHNWLKSAAPIGPKFRVQLYELKDLGCTCPECDYGFTRSVQKGVDVGIATLILKLATQNVYDRLILATGDGDFEDAIAYVKSELHKQVWMLGAQATLSPNLQSYADHVIWLDDLNARIERD